MTESVPCVVIPYSRFLECQDRRRTMTAERLERDRLRTVDVERVTTDKDSPTIVDGPLDSATPTSAREATTHAVRRHDL